MPCHFTLLLNLSISPQVVVPCYIAFFLWLAKHLVVKPCYWTLLRHLVVVPCYPTLFSCIAPYYVHLVVLPCCIALMLHLEVLLWTLSLHLAWCFHCYFALFVVLCLGFARLIYISPHAHPNFFGQFLEWNGELQVFLSKLNFSHWKTKHFKKILLGIFSFLCICFVCYSCIVIFSFLCSLLTIGICCELCRGF